MVAIVRLSWSDQILETSLDKITDAVYTNVNMHVNLTGVKPNKFQFVLQR
jgi:hypothetical protein